MKLTTKKYKTQKIKLQLKNSDIIFLTHSINRVVDKWIHTEQELKKLNISYYKVLNKVALKTIEKSVHKNTLNATNGSTFFLKPTINSISKNVLLNNFELLLFTVLSVKLNNNIYSAKQLQTLYSLNYKKNVMVMNQFFITSSKFYIK